MTSLDKHEVFVLVSSASVPSEKIIGTKWVFKVKADHTLKERVVVQGWEQVTRVDCGCACALVGCIERIRMALVIAAHEDWDILQRDVQAAFLHGSLQNKVYVNTPPGYGSIDAATGFHAMKLKIVCGLRQSPRNWFNTTNDSLDNIGFTATTSDPCVYTIGISDTFTILTLYVDDLLLLGGNTPVLKDLKRKLIG